MASTFRHDPGLPDRILELLEEIEAATCEIHCRSLASQGQASQVAEEAGRLAAEGERLVARWLDRYPELVLGHLQERRDRLLTLLEEGP